MEWNKNTEIKTECGFALSRFYLSEVRKSKGYSPEETEDRCLGRTLGGAQQVQESCVMKLHTARSSFYTCGLAGTQQGPGSNHGTIYGTLQENVYNKSRL